MIGKETTTLTVSKELTINNEDIIKLLKHVSYIPEEVPNNQISVTFNIPGGGDWSNTTLDINEAYPIKVSYSITTKSPTNEDANGR